MAVKIRLQRHGRKRKPYYFIVIANSTSPRDGKFIERIGSYNPNTNPATINIDTDSALKWLDYGAQPTETVKAILSYQGVLFKKHLLRGLKKGALTEQQVEEKFAEFLNNRKNQVSNKIEKLSQQKSEEEANRLKAEAEVFAKRAEAIAAKKAEELAALKAAEAAENAEEDADSTPSEEVTAENQE